MNFPKVETIDDLFFNVHENDLRSSFSNIQRNPHYKWIPSDTEELFLKNCEKYRDTEDTQIADTLEYYKNNPIDYYLNEVSFRDSSLNSKPYEVDVYLGCSFTLGIGVHREDSWTYKLEEYLDFPSINAGLPGTGINTHYRILVTLSKRFKIRKVFYYFHTFQTRIEWFHSSLTSNKLNRYLHLASTSTNVSENDIENVLNENNRTLWMHSGFYALKGFCESRGIQFYYQYMHNSDCLYHASFNNPVIADYKFDVSRDYLARDLGHRSIRENHYIFLYFLGLMGEKIFENFCFPFGNS